jgi:hypothetical protein
MQPNGHDDTTANGALVVADVPLASSPDEAGWIGATVLKTQIAQLQHSRQMQTAAMRAQIYWQAEVARY